jgi:catechol 2,3-dioxygenase-like lactoylglutathione lyase family enzyme
MLGDKIDRTNTILYCRHWQPTVDFYRDVLKLPVNHETAWLVEFRATEGSYLSIADAKCTTIEAAGGRGTTLSLKIGDLDSVHRLMQSVGVEASRIRKIWGSRAFYIHDPEGHRLELWTEAET